MSTDGLLTRWGSPHLCRNTEIIQPLGVKVQPSRVKCWNFHSWEGVRVVYGDAEDGGVARRPVIGKSALDVHRNFFPGLGHLRKHHDLDQVYVEGFLGQKFSSRGAGCRSFCIGRPALNLQRSFCPGLGHLGKRSHVRRNHDLDCEQEFGLSGAGWRRLGVGKVALNVQRSSCPGREEVLGHPRRIHLRRNPQVCVELGFSSSGAGWRSSRRGVRVSAFEGLRSWFRNFLFESTETSDFDIDSDVGDGLEEPEIEEDVVELEERADPDADQVSGEKDEIDQMLEDDRRFFRWKMETEARNEVRDFQASGRDPDSKDWEDWLDDTWSRSEENLTGGKGGWYEASPDWEKNGVPREPPSKPERGMKRTIKELFFRIFEPEDEVLEDLQFEERISRFTSRTTAKFVGILIIVPWITDFLLHDFVLVPFLETYVEKVPLAAKVLDIRESQKLKIIESLKLERQRLRFEAEIGKAPPLSDDEVSEHIREEALELREEYRLENRQAFASIWSDFSAGLTILLLLILNPQKVSIMRLTGERLFTNISDTGKAFIIILLTDIFLGYHSELGWETVSEMVLEHYGVEVSQASIYVFVAIVPVTIDACFKLWVFRFFRTLSPSASATFREMQRH